MCQIADIEADSEQTKGSGSLARSLTNCVTASLKEVIDHFVDNLVSNDGKYRHLE